MSRINSVIVTDATEGPEWVKVTGPAGEKLVEARDPEGVRIAIDQLAGEYESE